jgi:hypothetical protein
MSNVRSPQEEQCAQLEAQLKGVQAEIKASTARATEHTAKVCVCVRGVHPASPIFVP